MENNIAPEKKDTLSPFASICIVTICVMVIIASCILLYLPFAEEQADGKASVQAVQDDHNQTVSSFPHRMTISGKTAYLERIDLFELYGNHGYFGYVIVTIDRGSLSDDDVYWIMKGKRYNWELDSNAHYWPDGTEGDISSLHFLACRYDSDYIYFIFNTDHHRYSLKGTYFSIAVTYLADGADHSDQYRYGYLVEFSGVNYHDSIDHLPEQTIYVFGKACSDAAP